MSNKPLTAEEKEDILCTLLGARTMIECEGWTQGSNARSDAGIQVSLNDPEAARFCAEGALLLASRPDPNRYFGPGYFWAEGYLRQEVGTRALHFWNDSKNRTKDEVLDAFDAAIARLEKELDQ